MIGIKHQQKVGKNEKRNQKRGWQPTINQKLGGGGNEEKGPAILVLRKMKKELQE